MLLSERSKSLAQLKREERALLKTKELYVQKIDAALADNRAQQQEQEQRTR